MAAKFRTAYEWSTGQTWVFDGNEKIALITPPRIAELVLNPGGKTAVSWLTLFWWQYTNNEQPGRSVWLLDELRLDDHDPSCYQLFVRSHNQGKTVSSTTQLELTYDNSLNSYVYDVRTAMNIQVGKEWLVEPQGGIEFANIWLKDSVGPAIPYSESRPQRWSFVLYNDPNGNIIRLPLNHLDAPLLGHILFNGSKGWLGFFNYSGGNPVLEMDSPTALATRAEVCAWGYDIHLIRRTPPQSFWKDHFWEDGESLKQAKLHSGQEIATHYRLYSISGDESEDLLKKSIQPAISRKIIEDLARPAFRFPDNTFQDGVWPHLPDSSWFWSPSHPEGLTWNRNDGHLDNASLCIKNDLPRIAWWQTQIGPDFWSGPLPAKPFTISGWIRTDNASGKGAALSFRYSNYQIEMGQRIPFPEFKSTFISRTNNWTYCKLQVSEPPDGATRAYLSLILDGLGKAWFDEISITVS